MNDLVINLFRIFQTEQKLQKENIKTEKKKHYEVESKIRDTIRELGGFYLMIYRLLIKV